jgi:hypothetical protein
MRAYNTLVAFGMFLLLACLVPPPAAAASKFYDFAHGMGNDFSFYNPTDLFTLDDTQGELRLSKPADTYSDVLKLARISSRFILLGNFDVKVKYKQYLVLPEGGQQEFQLYGKKGFTYFISRSNESWIGGQNYHVWIGSVAPIPPFATSDTGGILRFVRQGNDITTYFKSPGAANYTMIYGYSTTSPWVRLGMVLQNQPASHAALDAAYDDLDIQADAIVFPGQVPYDLLLLNEPQGSDLFK